MFIAILLGMPIVHSPWDVILLIIGSLLPDIDMRQSTLGRYNLLNRTRLFKHRGKCHSLLGIILLSFPFALLGWWSMFIVLYGALTHLLGDLIMGLFPGKRTFKLKIW